MSGRSSLIRKCRGIDPPVDSELPYTREELVSRPETFPERGLYCQKCRTNVPQFADLSDEDASLLLYLIEQDLKEVAMDELQAATGCSKRFAKIWVLHAGKPDSGITAPCPYCAGQLKTALAKQCQHCYMDWHDPDKPRNLRGS